MQRRGRNISEYIVRLPDVLAEAARVYTHLFFSFTLSCHLKTERWGLRLAKGGKKKEGGKRKKASELWRCFFVLFLMNRHRLPSSYVWFTASERTGSCERHRLTFQNLKALFSSLGDFISLYAPVLNVSAPPPPHPVSFSLPLSLWGSRGTGQLGTCWASSEDEPLVWALTGFRETLTVYAWMEPH